MDSVLTFSAVDHGFDPWSDQTKDNKIDICCYSAKHAAIRSKSKNWFVRNPCPSEATCLPVGCCLSEIVL